MKSLLLLAAACVFAAAVHAQSAFIKTVAIRYDASDSIVRFGAEELEKALIDSEYDLVPGEADFEIRVVFYEPGMGPQSYRIDWEGDRAIRVTAGDSVGAQYGLMEVGEQIILSDSGDLQSVQPMARKPFILRRGLKHNIPFDGRAPSYDDTGTAAQENIATMWDFAFWKHYLDTMARNRYNVLSIWTTNPYGGIVELPKYPEANYDNVARVTLEITPQTNNHFTEFDVFDPAYHEIILEISLQDKIQYWTRVFDYAESLGIEIYMFHWNIFAWGAEGKYGITAEQDNRRTIAYQRYCIEQFLKTYPQIDGIGVSAGERVNRRKDWKIDIEEWLYETYGMGVLDALEADPAREIRFIFRHLWSDLSKSAEAFANYPVTFNTSHKYARARLYSNTTSPYLDLEYRNKLEETGIPCWLNLRNDDLYVLRWGHADYVREFLHNLPRDVMQHEAGFYMGSDSYVWGKEFISKDLELSGQWEVDKHWYRFMLWGRLGYDITLPNRFFERRLAKHFPVNGQAMRETWDAASQIISWIDRFFFRVNDLEFAPEACSSKWGFLTVDESFFKHPPLQGSGLLSVQEYAEKLIAGEPFHGITPMDVADNLDRLAEKGREGVSITRRSSGRSPELYSTLKDIEAMCYLGHYYADKIRGAADLAVYRANPARLEHHRAAIRHFENALEEWRMYAHICVGQYKPQLLARTHYLDWLRIQDYVEAELESVRAEGPPLVEVQETTVLPSAP